MAEINASSDGRGSGGKVRAKKSSIKIDMTPMVDLAFLLLTFFILTRTFHSPHVMELQMPDRDGSAPVSIDNVMHVVLSDKDRIHWWTGEGPVNTTDYSPGGVRKVILEKMRENPRLVVLIKPHDESRFANMVDILDEMKITKATRYAIVEFSDADRQTINRD